MCKKLKINCVDKCECTKLKYYDQKLFYFVDSDVVTDRSLALPTKPLPYRTSRVWFIPAPYQPPTVQAESGSSLSSLFSFGWLKRLLTLFTPSDWKTENDLSGEIWLDEFSQIIKKNKLTVETYHSMRKYGQQS